MAEFSAAIMAITNLNNALMKGKEDAESIVKEKTKEVRRLKQEIQETNNIREHSTKQEKHIQDQTEQIEQLIQENTVITIELKNTKETSEKQEKQINIQAQTLRQQRQNLEDRDGKIRNLETMIRRQVSEISVLKKKLTGKDLTIASCRKRIRLDDAELMSGLNQTDFEMSLETSTLIDDVDDENGAAADPVDGHADASAAADASAVADAAAVDAVDTVVVDLADDAAVGAACAVIPVADD